MSSNRIEFTVKNDITDVYRKYISIVSVVMNTKLTDLEIDLLIAVTNYNYKFDEISRKEICKDYNISKDLLGNYLKKLRDKGFITSENIVIDELQKLKLQPNSINYITVTLEQNN